MKKLKIEYIMAGGKIYRQQLPGVQNPNWYPGFYYPVCYIKKLLLFGAWQIDYWDSDIKGKDGFLTDNQIPNARLILYPGIIQEIRYIK